MEQVIASVFTVCYSIEGFRDIPTRENNTSFTLTDQAKPLHEFVHEYIFTKSYPDKLERVNLLKYKVSNGREYFDLNDTLEYFASHIAPNTKVTITFYEEKYNGTKEIEFRKRIKISSGEMPKYNVDSVSYTCNLKVNEKNYNNNFYEYVIAEIIPNISSQLDTSNLSIMELFCGLYKIPQETTIGSIFDKSTLKLIDITYYYQYEKKKNAPLYPPTNPNIFSELFVWCTGGNHESCKIKEIEEHNINIINNNININNNDLYKVNFHQFQPARIRPYCTLCGCRDVIIENFLIPNNWEDFLKLKKVDGKCLNCKNSKNNILFYPKCKGKAYIDKTPKERSVDESHKKCTSVRINKQMKNQQALSVPYWTNKVQILKDIVINHSSVNSIISNLTDPFYLQCSEGHLISIKEFDTEFDANSGTNLKQNFEANLTETINMINDKKKYMLCPLKYCIGELHHESALMISRPHYDILMSYMRGTRIKCPLCKDDTHKTSVNGDPRLCKCSQCNMVFCTIGKVEVGCCNCHIDQSKRFNFYYNSAVTVKKSPCCNDPIYPKASECTKYSCKTCTTTFCIMCDRTHPDGGNCPIFYENNSEIKEINDILFGGNNMEVFSFLLWSYLNNLLKVAEVQAVPPVEDRIEYFYKGEQLNQIRIRGSMLATGTIPPLRELFIPI